MCLPRTELRKWLLAAYDKGMANGDYVFIYVENEIPDDAVVQNITTYTAGDGRNEDAKKVYESLLVVCFTTVTPTVITNCHHNFNDYHYSYYYYYYYY